MGLAGYLPSNPQNSRLVDVSTITGAASNPRDTGIVLIGGLAQHPATSILYGLTTVASNPASSLVTIKPETGQSTLVGPTGLPFLVEGDLAFNPVDGMLYGLQDGGTSLLERNLFRINTANGSATIIGSLGTTGDYSAMAFTPAGVLYVVDDRPNNDDLANAVLSIVDASNGTVTSSTQLNLRLGSTLGMAIDPTTGVAYLADGGGGASTTSLFTLDFPTGTLTLIGPLGDPSGVAGLAFVTVPEPSSLVFLVLSVPVCQTLRRRLGVMKSRPAKTTD